MSGEPWLGQLIHRWADANLMGNNWCEVNAFAIEIADLEDRHANLQAEYRDFLNGSIRSSGQASAQLVNAILSGRMTINDDEEVMPDGLT